MKLSRVSTLGLVSAASLATLLTAAGCGMPILSGYLIYKGHYALSHKKSAPSTSADAAGRPVTNADASVRAIEARRLTSEEAATTRIIGVRSDDALTEQDALTDYEGLTEAIWVAATEMLSSSSLVLAQIDQLPHVVQGHLSERFAVISGEASHSAAVFIARFREPNAENTFQYNHVGVQLLPADCTEGQEDCQNQELSLTPRGVKPLVIETVTPNFKVRVIYSVVDNTEAQATAEQVEAADVVEATAEPDTATTLDEVETLTDPE